MASEPYRAPRGTRDLLPDDLVLVRHLERTAQRLARAFQYGEIRPPLLEETRLFQRSLGEASDVVEKEMFTVPPRAEGSPAHSFRPEGTAGVARAYVEAGCPARAPFQKWFYVGPMFRYERPQKGRERQFTQFGVEVFGAVGPRVDAEVVDLCMRFFEALGFGSELEVRLNTMGDEEDRDRWRAALRSYFEPLLGERCEDCRTRFERNVFRLLDCKEPRCQASNAAAPRLRALLGEASAAHFDGLLDALRALGREPVEDPSIVRGLDYYTRTVFEVHYPSLGARSALCGGGRYDGLVEEMGGVATPAVGFAIGFTPTEIACRELGLPPAEDLADLVAEASPQVYLVAITADERDRALALAGELRAAGVPGVALDLRERSAKAQFKEANALGARSVAVLGPEEREADTVKLRDMDSGEEDTVAQAELADAVLARTVR